MAAMPIGPSGRARVGQSLTSSEALAENVIDLVADDVGDLLEQVART